MSKIYRLIIISIMAVIFAIGCSDTNSQSSGGGNITDNGSSGGNGGDGSGGDGSGSSSEIINSTMRASASQDNALLYTFFTPASATNGASLKYSWDFDDNAVETTDNNIINHEFSKYGKSYNVTLEVSNMQTNDKENVSMIIPLPKPTIYFACSSAGLDIYCLPNISQQGIMDVEYTWNIYNSSNQQIASLNTTGSHELATYTLPLSGTYQVELIGRSEKVDGDLIYTENVEVNQSFNKGSISYSTVGSDKLQYRLRYSAGSTNGDILNYCWEIDDEINSGKCESDANYHQGTSSTYDEIMHTFPKYKKAYNIKGYVKDASGDNPAVSSAIIYQDLPVVAVTVTGTGLSKKFSPVFTYKPAGSLQYIWSFGDGAQSSAESPEYTYQKSGYYTVSLEIISDKFDTSIGSIKSDDVNININEHINNVVIETSLKARDKSGEKYVITSPAQSTNGALYYIWKVDGAVISEGENIHTLEYSFPVFGKSYSVSLEVEDKTTGTKVIAEPKVITTKKPVAKITLPPYSTPNTQVQIQAKVYFEDTGEDFILIADNPQYEWYINGQNENQNKSSIDKFFTQTQQVPVKLNISAENIEGRELSAESTIYINELNLECSIADDAEDMYGAIVSCQIPTDIEGSTSYYYKYTYTEYMNGVPTLVEVPATEKTQFKMKLYEEDSQKRYQSRDIELQWYAGIKGQYQYSGNIKFSYKAKEPVINRVAKIYAANDLNECDYILSDTGDFFTSDFRYIYSIKETIKEPVKFFDYGNVYQNPVTFFQSESGKIYKLTSLDSTHRTWDEEKGLELITGIDGNILCIDSSGKYIITDTGIYTLDYYGNAIKIFDGAIKYAIKLKLSSEVYIILEDGRMYRSPSMLHEIKTEGIKIDSWIIDYGAKELVYFLTAQKELCMLDDDKIINTGLYVNNSVKHIGVSGEYPNYIQYILIDDKLYEYQSGIFKLKDITKNLSIKQILINGAFNPNFDSLIVTNNGELYLYDNENNMQRVLSSEYVNNVDMSLYNIIGGNIIISTNNGTYLWHTNDMDTTTPQKAQEDFNIIQEIGFGYGALTTKGLYLGDGNGGILTLVGTDLPLDPVLENNKMYIKMYYNDSYESAFVLINDKLYGIDSSTGNAQLFDQSFFEQN